MSKSGDANLNINAKDNTGKAFKSVQNGLRDVASSVSIVDGPLSAISGRVNAAGAAFGRLNPLLVLGGAGVGAFMFALKSGVSDTIEFERQMLRMEGQLKATGSAVGFTAQELSDMAIALDSSTLADDKDVRAAIGQMLTYKKVAGETFKEAISLSQDYAEVFGKGIDRSSVKIGRALDSFQGLSTLNRELNLFSENELKVAKSAYEAGNLIEYQGSVIEKLKGKIGGAGVGAAGGAAGAIDGLALSWRLLMREFSSESGTVEVVGGISSAIAGMNKKILEMHKRNKKARNEYANLTDVEHERLATLRDLNLAIKKVAEATTGKTTFTINEISEMFNLMEAEEERLKVLNKIIAADKDKGKVAERNENLATEIAQEEHRRAIKKQAFMDLEKDANSLYEKNLSKREVLNRRYKADFDSVLSYIEAANYSGQEIDRKHYDTLINIQKRYMEDKAALDKPDKPKSTKAEDKRAKKAALDLDRLEAELSGETALREQKLKEWFDSRNELINKNVVDEERAEALRLETTRKYANERKKIEEDVSNKKLSLIMNAGTQIAGILSDLSQSYGRSSKADFERNKMYSRGVAVMNTAAGITKAWEQGGTFGWIGATAVAAAGLKQLSIINGTTYGSSSGGISSGSGSGGSASGLPELPQTLRTRYDKEDTNFTINLSIDGEFAAKIIKVGQPVAIGRDYVVSDNDEEFNTQRLV